MPATLTQGGMVVPAAIRTWGFGTRTAGVARALRTDTTAHARGRGVP
ncbi:hypothetical protein [Nitriliruptor alkaliphilus]|nr:hypothetical protein [Nitriliruptor alkaliphilus]